MFVNNQELQNFDLWLLIQLAKCLIWNKGYCVIVYKPSHINILGFCNIFKLLLFYVFFNVKFFINKLDVYNHID